MSNSRPSRDDLATNPNSLHQFHAAIRGPKGVPSKIVPIGPNVVHPVDPEHPYAVTSNISLKFYHQRRSNSPFGYDHYVSLPPSYDSDESKSWPLILFLHGSGESQRSPGESYASIRHGIPKLTLCYDKLKSDQNDPLPFVEIPMSPRLRKNKQSKQGDKSIEPVPAETCALLSENFVTVTPSLDMRNGYGWSAPILSALLDEIIERYRIDIDRIHLTGFSMGGYGVLDLAFREPTRFASLMPICGGGDPLQTSQLKHVPIWIHHGAKDDIIPAKASQIMYDALVGSGGQDVRFSCYPESTHDSWTAAYNNVEVYQWMLSCKRMTDG